VALQWGREQVAQKDYKMPWQRLGNLGGFGRSEERILMIKVVSEEMAPKK
jgi:hypothetical protein